ncbi:MAG: VOC family protein [Chloroflexi bacterium]|nr:VOC family protein [Chloroflexota bacterium]
MKTQSTSFASTVGAGKIAADNGWKLRKIGHVMLGCADVRRSLDFYNGLLGLEIKAKIPGFAFLDTGAVTLCLSEPLARFSGSLEGATEVVFTVDDIDQACERLRERGIEFIAGPHQATDTEWSAIFRDPDGHKLSIFGPRANPCKG